MRCSCYVHVTVMHVWPSWFRRHTQSMIELSGGFQGIWGETGDEMASTEREFIGV